MKNSELLQALIVTAEVTGTDLSEGAARVMMQDLMRYDGEQVVAALSRCRKECKGKLTLFEIISRIDDGRPQPNEAWAIVQPIFGDESISCVWTTEMAQAYDVARNIEDDNVARRIAFLEAYNANVQKARDAGIPVKWDKCLGWDNAGRDSVLLDAIAKGRLQLEHVMPYLTQQNSLQDAKRLADSTLKKLGYKPNRLN